MAENQVKVSQVDNVPNWLASKIQGGYGIILTNNGTCLRIDCSGTGPNGMVAVDSQDKNLGFLSSKISSGTGISISNTGSALEISANTQTGDHKIIVDSLDTNPDYLLNKLTAGSNVTLTNLGSSIEISSIDTGMLNPMTTAGDIIVGAASGTPDRLPIGSEGQVLTVSSGSPAWVAIPTQTGDHKVAVDSADSSPDYLANKITAGSNVSLTNTGSAIQVSATDTIWPDPMTTEGDIVYENSSLQPARLGIGTNGQVLTVDSGIPSWQNIPTQTGDHKVLATSDDATSAGALADKLYVFSPLVQSTATAGGVKKVTFKIGAGTAGQVLTSVSDGLGNVSASWASPAVQTGDHKVVVDGNDTSPGYLGSKLVQGTGITLTSGANDITIAADTQTGDHKVLSDSGDGLADYLGNKITVSGGLYKELLTVGTNTRVGLSIDTTGSTAGQVLSSTGSGVSWTNLPLNIDWVLPPALTNGDFNQVIDRTFYVRVYPSLQMRAINHVSMILSGAVAADVIRVAVYDNARTMVAYGESTGSSSTFRRVNLTQLQPWTPGTNDLYYLGVSIHASSNSSTKIKTASVTSPSYCWYEDVALTSGRAMPAPSSLTASGSKVPIIGLRGR